MDSKDVVVIGAGPAGIAAAIQLKRSNIEPVLFEKEEIGGLLRNANLVENYPGFPDGITGLDLVKLLEKQLKNTGVTVSFESVSELDYRNEVFFTKTNRRTIRSNIAVIATGTKPRKTSVIDVSDEIKSRVFYEIVPIIDSKKKKVAIIGAGDAAFDYALNLSKNNEVTILNRSEQTGCLPLLWERYLKSENISYLRNVTVERIRKESNNLTIKCIIDDSQKKIQIKSDYVIFATGREPCLDFLGNEFKKNFENLIKSNRFYMIGDVKNELYRQAAISVGDGIKAAMKIYNTLGGYSV
ncbi:NAD(P)/FAD-dependent oxidoreductase [Candidatus Latescibacterota bacterium]